MSRRHAPHAHVALLWTPNGISAFDASTRSHHQFADAASAAATLGGRSITVAVSRRSMFVRTMRLPDAPHEDVRQILQVRAAEYFPLGGAELALDFHLTTDVNAEGRLAVVAAMPATELRRINADLRSVGFKINRVVPISFGSALLALEHGQPTTAVVSREPGAIGIDVIVDGELRATRSVGSPHAIASEVCRTYSVAGIPCGMTISAGDAVVPEAEIEVSMSPLDAIALSWPDAWHLNLELPEEVAQRKRKENGARTRTAGLMALGAVALMALVASDRSDRTAEIRRQEAKLAAEQRKLKSIQTTAEADAQTAIKYQNLLKRGFQPAQRLGDVVTVISNRVPAGIWLSGITVERGKPIVIRGTAKTSNSVTDYYRALNGEPRLRDVRLVFANNAQIEQTPVVQFSLTAFPVGNLPLTEATARRRTASR